MIHALVIVGALITAQPELPLVTVTHDNTRIDRSCRVSIPKGTILPDEDGNGVIQIVAEGVTVEFVEGEAELIAAPTGTPWDQCVGIGIVVDGVRGVTLRGAHSHRYKVGILARNADGLVIDGADLAGGYAQELGSTPQAEDSGDWLSPHHNDANEWLERYGAALWVEDSSDVTLRGVYSRRRQNGIVLDNVRSSRVIDCDCSFLSGWGLAMWRSTGNVVSRNAFDFCVRGYSHGVYNRGQDSAGILIFEQCSNNSFVQNSATHGGDGVFGFAGIEAIGQGPARLGLDYRRAGSNHNMFVGNDFSYAAAHGLEMTFGYGTIAAHNRFAGNAICGLWGGYSSWWTIIGNEFAHNGDAGYGLERGGVNIEHAQECLIANNVFRDNAVGVHLWWDEDAGLSDLPWAKANDTSSRDGVLRENMFVGGEIGVELRGDCAHVVEASNRFDGVGREIVVEGGARRVERPSGGARVPSGIIPRVAAPGDKSPVGARTDLAGGENIIMLRWFPWDHADPAARLARVDGRRHVYELFGFEADPAWRVEGEGVRVRAGTRADATEQGRAIPGVRTLIVEAEDDVDCAPYVLTIEGERRAPAHSETILSVVWDVTVFPSPADPREEYEAWVAGEHGAAAVSRKVEGLGLRFGGRGPGELGFEGWTGGADHFGTIAETIVRLPEGSYELETISDDGVRVSADGGAVIENWTWHAPTRDAGTLVVEKAGPVRLRVEHFELDGMAQLELRIRPIGGH